MPTAADSARTRAVSAWFAHNARELPWRAADCPPWGVLVSEVMLQQTPVVRVLPVWEQWMERWPSPGDLAACSQADAVRAWGRLGYPRRAKRLWECARVLVDRHNGELPRDPEALRSLPGVGEYTAAAVLAFAFGTRAVVLDTNVRRVIARAWSGEPLPEPTLRRAERDLAARIAPEADAEAAVWAAASMELGALVCTARSPSCQVCPLSAECAWLRAGAQGLAQAARSTQPWHGTDRQVRGRIMAELRTREAPVLIEGQASLADVEPGQLERCLESLLADGLVAEDSARRGWFVLA